MRNYTQELVLPSSVGGLAVVLLAWWLGGTHVGDFSPRLPGQDGSLPTITADSSATSPPTVAGEPTAGDGLPSQLTAEWLGFRGPQRSGVVSAGPPLARQWPPAGPPVLWTVTLAEGYAGAAVSNGCVYVLDYDEKNAADTLRCFSLDDAREIWRNSYPVSLTRNHGLTRTVPAIVDDLVITIGPRCHVACWETRSGRCRWLIDLARDHGAVEPRWYTGQCPLIDGDKLILAPCGDALLMAVDYRSGEVLWTSPNPRGWEMTHVSIMPMDLAGRRTYVYCGSGGVAGVDAENGELLWDSTEWPTTFATCPSPLPLPGQRVFLCSGYGPTVGSLLLQVARSDNVFAATPVVKLTPRQFNSEHHTPIVYGDHIYGVHKRGGGQLVCLDLEGNEVWNSGGDRFGHGPYLIADGLILVMDDRGWLSMAAAAPRGYERLGRHEVFSDGHDAWGPMALVAGRLILRDLTRMSCLSLSTLNSQFSTIN